MKTMTGHTADLVKELPADLASVLGERRIVELALEAVQIVARRDPAFSGQRFGAFRPEMLLTLLTYCYATTTYGSEDVEWASEHETTVRYVCGRTPPDCVNVRQFRRANRERIEQCLVHVLNQSMAEHFGEHNPVEDARRWAGRKVELAILMDAAAND